MKTSIIIHSVCGNVFLMGKLYQQAFKNKNIEATIYRVNDPDLAIWKNQFDSAKEFYHEICKLPVATPDVVLASDLIIFGSPNYCKNVSGEFKQFLDSFAIYFLEEKLRGKIYACFTSGSTLNAGAEHCLQAIHYVGGCYGMISYPVPVFTQLKLDQSSLGIVHRSGDFSDIRPNQKTEEAINQYISYLVESISVG